MRPRNSDNDVEPSDDLPKNVNVTQNFCVKDTYEEVKWEWSDGSVDLTSSKASYRKRYTGSILPLESNRPEKCYTAVLNIKSPLRTDAGFYTLVVTTKNNIKEYDVQVAVNT